MVHMGMRQQYLLEFSECNVTIFEKRDFNKSMKLAFELLGKNKQEFL